MKSREFTITQGLFHRMVIQRTGRGIAPVEFSGTSSVAGKLKVVICDPAGKRRVVDGGRISAGRFHFKKGSLPVGGPYHLTLTLATDKGRDLEIEVRDVLVGDVWILAGQSNMEGYGLLRNAAKPHPMVRAFLMDDRWDIAREPIHRLWEAVDPVHGELSGGSGPRESDVGTGPGLFFATEMFQRTSIPQGLIACAHRGTSISQWNPALKSKGGGSLYGALARRLKKNGGRAAGVLWYQGESDTDEAAASHYTKRMRALLGSLRRDAGNPNLPFLMVQIARMTERQDVPGKSFWNAIQDQQRIFTERQKWVALVPAIDLTLDDAIHVSGIGQKILGHRLVGALQRLVDSKGLNAGPRPGKVRVVSNPDRTDGSAVEISFENLEGELRAIGRPSGFSLLSPSGCEMAYETRLLRDKVLLLTTRPKGLIFPASVFYGVGANPYCNVTDRSGNPLPVFGPLPLRRSRWASPFLRSWKVAHLADEFASIKERPPLGQQAFELFESEEDFASLRNRIVQVRTGCFLLEGHFETSEPMKVTANLGYDGPVHLWVDGASILRDAHGKTPAWPDKKVSRSFLLAPGRHQVHVLLGTDDAKAWGVFLRFERRDVSGAQQPVIFHWIEASSNPGKNTKTLS